jgi:transposase
MNYSTGFKARMVQRMAGPEGISANALSNEVGIGQPTLSRWLRAARSVKGMSKQRKPDKGEESKSEGRKWTPQEKWRVVQEASRIPDKDLGAFLRREGLHQAQLEEWRAVVAALSGTKRKSTKASPEAKRIRELERDLRRKEKALAEVIALLALKKKVQEIWGDEDDDTDTRSGT